MLQNSQFYKDLKKSQKTITKAQTELNNTISLLERNEREEAIKQSIVYENTLERLVNQGRLLPVATGNRNGVEQSEEIILNNTDIQIFMVDNMWLHIEMPLLLPKKEFGNASYIRATLNAAIKRYTKNEEYQKFDENVVLCFQHCYSPERKKRKMRDHDNIELNSVVDVIALYFLIDDSPQFCKHYYESTLSSCDKTNIYIVPETHFKLWLENHDK